MSAGHSVDTVLHLGQIHLLATAAKGGPATQQPDIMLHPGPIYLHPIAEC